MTYLLVLLVACAALSLKKNLGLGGHVTVALLVLGLTTWYWLTGKV
jgi:hypothetical protein